MSPHRVLLLPLGLLLGTLSGCGVDEPAAEPGGARRLTDRPGVEDYVAWSPDGRTLAYAASERGDVFGGDWDVWRYDLETGEARDLTPEHPGDDRFPAWSPDGQSIAFWSDREGGGYFVMASDGSMLRAVRTSSSVAASAPAWSADGARLACIVLDGDGVATEIVELGSGERQRVALPGNSTRRFDLAWSPDDRYLAYVDGSSLTASVSQIRVLDLATNESVDVTDGRTSNWGPIWSSDGRELLYVSSRSGKRDVWRRQMADGRPIGEPARVTEDVGIRHAALSPDGSRLAYSQGRTIANVWRVPVLPGRPASWEDAERITSDEGFIEYIDLSPDESTLLLSTDKSGNPDIWTHSLADGLETRLTDHPTPEWGASWSADGSRVAYYGFRSGNRDLWIMNADGTGARQLTDHPADDLYPAVSPDGELVAFYSIRTGNRDLFVMPAGGGEARRITSYAGDDLFPQWSPDGSWLAFHSDRGGAGRLWRISPEGGVAEPVTAGPARFGRWSRDGRSIYFVGWGDRLGNLFRVTLASGVERPITDLAGRSGSLGTYALTLGPDYLYFTWEENVGDLWTRSRAMAP